jgi:hypothetical protein
MIRFQAILHVKELTVKFWGKPFLSFVGKNWVEIYLRKKNASKHYAVSIQVNKPMALLSAGPFEKKISSFCRRNVRDVSKSLRNVRKSVRNVSKHLFCPARHFSE